jgi:hypothetical protein
VPEPLHMLAPPEPQVVPADAYPVKLQAGGPMAQVTVPDSHSTLQAAPASQEQTPDWQMEYSSQVSPSLVGVVVATQAQLMAVLEY